jgi:hypothetical protein
MTGKFMNIYDFSKSGQFIKKKISSLIYLQLQNGSAFEYFLNFHFFELFWLRNIVCKIGPILLPK